MCERVVVRGGSSAEVATLHLQYVYFGFFFPCDGLWSDDLCHLQVIVISQSQTGVGSRVPRICVISGRFILNDVFMVFLWPKIKFGSSTACLSRGRLGSPDTIFTILQIPSMIRGGVNTREYFGLVGLIKMRPLNVIRDDGLNELNSRP